ncbi:MAG: single-strand selective monofunctional uracil DNA glycosylase [Verrucomicrobiales bacterium]|jgi:single-strand selective monofunctional uracil DNA glycosylase
MPAISKKLITSARKLCKALAPLTFKEPVTHVYNPLEYARKPHEKFLRTYGDSKRKIVLLGMNPGPFGMAQTGVPFGEISAVRDWMKISAPVSKPEHENPKRPIEGFDCTRAEVSGRRLWGLASERFGTPEAFFSDHFVLNYCPLVWMEAGGRNVTPDKISAAEMAPVHHACERHLIEALETLQPEWAIGVGAFAEKRLLSIAPTLTFEPNIGKILHPSPASPAANKGWAEKVTQQMETLGVW